jgi:DNA-directed RNA polymerase subunit RPC12/RpoP
MGLGSPRFAAINKEHGILFVECSACGRKIIVKDSEKIVLKTKEEFTNGH